MEKRTDDLAERESLVDRIVRRRKMAEKAPSAALQIDRRSGQRTFTSPPR